MHLVQWAPLKPRRETLDVGRTTNRSRCPCRRSPDDRCGGRWLGHPRPRDGPERQYEICKRSRHRQTPNTLWKRCGPTLRSRCHTSTPSSRSVSVFFCPPLALRWCGSCPAGPPTARNLRPEPPGKILSPSGNAARPAPCTERGTPWSAPCFLGLLLVF